MRKPPAVELLPARRLGLERRIAGRDACRVNRLRFRPVLSRHRSNLGHRPETRLASWLSAGRRSTATGRSSTGTAGFEPSSRTLFGVEHADDLLARFHELEPEIQAARAAPSYREVLTLALERLAEEEGLARSRGRGERARPVAAVLAGVRRRPAGACRGERPRLEARDPLEHRPRPARRLDGGDRYRLRRVDRGRRDSARTSPQSGTGRCSANRRAPRPKIMSTSLRACTTTSSPRRELGIPTIWINRLDEPEDERPRATLPSLAGLADALDAALREVS